MAVDFVCRKCSGFRGCTYADEEGTLDGDVIEKVAKFSYLLGVLSSGGEGRSARSCHCKNRMRMEKV